MKREIAHKNEHRIFAFWRRTRRLTALLLSVWFLATFGVIFFARQLSELSLFGWTFSYYMAAQGILLIYMLIVGAYAFGMARLDRRFGEEAGNDD